MFSLRLYYAIVYLGMDCRGRWYELQGKFLGVDKN